MLLQNAIKSNLKIKKIVHWLLIPRGQARPKLWVRLFINPFFHKKGRSSIIRFNNRICSHAEIKAGALTIKTTPVFSVALNPAQLIKEYNFETGCR